LLRVRNREVVEKGYELLQHMQPIYLKDKRKSREEMIAAAKKDREMMNAINRFMQENH